MTARTLPCTAIALLASCVPEDVSVIDIHNEVTDCDDIVCGNTPKLGGQPFWELDESKQDWSPLGRFKIKSFGLPNKPLKLKVQGFQLLGISDEPAIYAGKGLEHATLVIESETGGQYSLTIDAVSTLPFMEGGADGTKIPTFRLSYIEIVNSVTQIQFLCPSDNIDRLGGKYAIVFAGDRYDKWSGKVSATGPAAKPWFNITCEDDALWKLAEFRHVQAAVSLPSYDTDLEDRDAAIRAIRADYCGDSHPWTTLGQKVDWANWGGWLTVDHVKNPHVEAIWDADGAYCLSKPRYAKFEDITCWPDYEDHYCSRDDIEHWVENGHRMITYVP